jgi:hypothetical protein
MCVCVCVHLYPFTGHHVQTVTGNSKGKKKILFVYDKSQPTPFKPGRLHNQRWKVQIHLYFPTTENAFRICVCQLGVHPSILVNLMGQWNITQNATVVFRAQH